MTSTKTLDYQFGQKHRDYMRRCLASTINVAEGAVRAGKTVDNVFAFAYALESAPDRIHLATGSTSANAKLNIGDCNGYGLEGIFRGRCHWGKYKGNEALYVSTPSGEKIIIFAGGAKADSYKKIRGNSYGMWIATEINLHHDNTIKEAFNRQLAAKGRKIFWDLNPDNPNSPIYTQYIDLYAEKQRKNEFPGGYNYEHFTIHDNATITQERMTEIISQYDQSSIWYMRDIEGLRCTAEGLIYRQFATAANSQQNRFAYRAEQDLTFFKIVLGVDFGGTGSGHSFLATGITPGYREAVSLASERFTGDDIDPDRLGQLFVAFVQRILHQYGRITAVYCDSAEQVLIRGFRKALQQAGLGYVRVYNALKSSIIDRIRLTTRLMAQGRYFYVPDQCQSLEKAFCTAVWNPKSLTKDDRLDDGTSDIDSLDGFEYTIEQDRNRFLNAER
ncbi:terminase large subunit domain-containing protein [Caproicibacterium amylolyticum]|uniref:PBSX family phage terminase large subunit n=1 Tax=Caproicibacterium amylolyticum TaxID=2766537 RepID=A0A7G9WF84_9FIRM|nr:PBSX family phage terminase large subunit [Caproicibacterium amylolyticum]